MDVARRLVRKFSGIATVYGCPFCDHIEKFPHGGRGRGYGLRMGGALHSKLAAHIRAEHPTELAHAAEVMDRPRLFYFQTEHQRADAYNEARWLQQDLIKATRGKWTFHCHPARGDGEKSFYMVTEYTK